MTEEIKEILFQLEIVARKHTIKVLDDGNIETMPASVVDELRLNNYSAKILLNYITNLQKENKQLKKSRDFHLRFNQSLMRRVDFYQSRNKKAIELLKRIQEKYGYMLEDVIFLLLQGGDE